MSDVPPATDLTRLRIDRDRPRRRRWVPVAVLAVLAAVLAALYPPFREYLIERRAPEVEVTQVAEMAPAAHGPAALPVLVATGYVVPRKSSEVGVKVGGRLQTVAFEEGTRVRAGEIIARIEHADLDAQLAASETAVAEAETQLAQMIATRDEDARNLERQRSLARDGVVPPATLTAAEAAAAVSAARVKSAEAAIASARARVRVTQETIENANVRAPFDGVVIRKRAEVGETVSPFGVAGQSSREGGAIATIADLRELEVQTEVSEKSVAKLRRGMPAVVKLQAYADREFDGRVREIFPSADRAKAIVEVRVSILNAGSDVKPEMGASVTFQELRAEPAGGAAADPRGSAPLVLVAKRAVTDQGGRPAVWVVSGDTATRRMVTLGTERIDQVEVASGLSPGETVVVNPGSGLVDHGRVKVKPR